MAEPVATGVSRATLGPLMRLGERMRSLPWLAVAAVLALHPAPAHAQTPPAGLYNKSISIFWSEDQTNQNTGGKTNHRVVHTSMSIYVSSAGRLFTQSGRERVNQQGKAVRSSGSSKSPDEAIRTSNSRYRGQLKFEGRTMINDVKYDSGVRRMIVTFDEGFRSCTVKFVHGKEDDAPGIVRRGMGGGLQLVTSLRVSGERCTVSDGNAFGA